MQTSFYASGFLYSLKTHQILLLKSQREDSPDFIWSTLGGECSKEEDAPVTFQRIINKLLNLNLKTKDIHPVYDYFYEARDQLNFVFYAEVKNPKEFDSLQGSVPSWIAFEQTSKLLFAGGAKQDVIVGERVINAKWRDDEAKRVGKNG